MLIAPYYPHKKALARAWHEALKVLPSDHYYSGTLQHRLGQLSRPGRWQARTVPGIASFQPEDGDGFSQCQVEWVETPAAILELNEVLRALDGVAKRER